MEAIIRAAIESVLTDLGITDVDFSVEHPHDLSHGDYASNVALVVAQEQKKNPHEMAEQLIALLEGKINEVEKIEIAGPGFINFFLTRDFFSECVTQISTEGERWGENNTWSGKKVIVEYTDPNPFKEFHIGHLFTNAVGESIARLCMMAGAETKRVNYQGDVGLHVACALYGMQKLGFDDANSFSASDLGKAYALGATAYKENEEAQKEIKAINTSVYERNDEAINALYDRGRQISLEYFEQMYAVLGTQFDAYFFESESGPMGKELVLKHPDIFPVSDGAHIFRGEEYGLHTRVFLNTEGLPTYEAKELALAKLKEEKLGAYDLSIISTANEITEYFKVLKKAMSFVYPELAEKTEHIGHGTVRLEGGKMSSRTGDIIAALAFIEEVTHTALEKMRENKPDATEDEARDVAIGAVKYAVLKSSIYQDSTFKKEQALAFEGDSGPYLQYTHARITSVLERAAEAGITFDTVSAVPVPEQPYDVERILYQFPEVILQALTERDPHHIAHFLIELAGSFNTFYAQEKIVDSSDEYAPYKCALARAVQTTLKNGLWVLGIKAPERM